MTPHAAVTTAAAADQPDPIAAGPSGPTVLVLGGTGFLGRALVKRLLQDGVGLRVLVRDTSGRARWLARQAVELVQGDIADTASVEAALDGIQHVFHLARGSGPAGGAPGPPRTG